MHLVEEGIPAHPFSGLLRSTQVTLPTDTREPIVANARSTAHLSAALPAGDKNGLAQITTQLVSDPETVHVAVMLLRTKTLQTDVVDHSVTPTVSILAIEPIGAGSDAAELQRLMRRAYEQRTGMIELPLDLERALEGIAVGHAAASDEDVEDPLDMEQLQAAVEIVIGKQEANPALLMERLPCSPERAAELMTLLQANGVIGPHDDDRPGSRVLVDINDLATILEGLRLYAGRKPDELPTEPGQVPDTVPMEWTGGPMFLDGTAAEQDDDGDAVPDGEKASWEDGYPEGRFNEAEDAGPTVNEEQGGDESGDDGERG